MAGYLVLNEHYIKYDDGNYKNQIDLFLHELMHVLAFDIDLYKSFPKNSNGQDFFKEDEYGDFYLQGDHTLSFVKDHFECDEIPGGIYKSSLIKSQTECPADRVPGPSLESNYFWRGDHDTDPRLSVDLFQVDPGRFKRLGLVPSGNGRGRRVLLRARLGL